MRTTGVEDILPHLAGDSDKSRSTAGGNTPYSLESQASTKWSTKGEKFILPEGDQESFVYRSFFILGTEVKRSQGR